MVATLTAAQVHALEVTERVASCFSLLGVAFIFFTFAASPAFRKPINRLVFYAAWGNALMNIATLISLSGIRAGQESALCQIQGFLIQMFFPADALWNFAMAINVYLTVFRRYSAEQLKTMEWKYHLMCYGCTFIVAFCYCFVSTEKRGKVYGPATQWCWITTDWNFLRIATCYGAAWCFIISTCTIYALAGRVIFKKRSQLRAFNSVPSTVVENPFTNYKTTEIEITSEVLGIGQGGPPSSYRTSIDQGTGGGKGRHSSLGTYDRYNVHISSAPLEPRSSPPMSMEAKGLGNQQAQRTIQKQNHLALEANQAAWGYTKCALLFFVSLLITWVPSSANRLFQLIHPDKVSFGAAFASSLVLPLMGFWNTVIYITISWTATKAFFRGEAIIQPLGWNGGNIFGSRGRVTEVDVGGWVKGGALGSRSRSAVSDRLDADDMERGINIGKLSSRSQSAGSLSDSTRGLR